MSRGVALSDSSQTPENAAGPGAMLKPGAATATAALTRDPLQHMAGEWLEAGASHVSVDTMGQGLDSVEGHLEALAQIADALDLR